MCFFVRTEAFKYFEYQGTDMRVLQKGSYT